MLISPAKRLRGEVALPGDKSISHRAAMLSAIAENETRIENFAESADCTSTLGCLRDLGVEIERGGNTVFVRGVGKNGFRPPSALLDCGNSGTTMRLLSGILAGQSFESSLTGDESLSGRPMRRIIEPLCRMGATVDSVDGHAPLTIHGRYPLRAIEYEPPVASAQIKSCVLLAGVYGDGETTVIEQVATRDHTERMLRSFGVEVRDTQLETGRRISVSGDAVLRSDGALVVPADISAAAFFMVAAACLEGSDSLLRNVGSNPTRTGIIEVLRACGVNVEMVNEVVRNNEPACDLHVHCGLGKPTARRLDGETIARVIDELPVLAVLGTQLESGLEVRDAAELRVKESDRIATVVDNLRRMGATVDEFDDGFRVGRSRLKGAQVDSFGDHRIAMAFAVAGLLAEKGETEIAGSECVDVSFPGFFEVLQNAVVYK
jgi:3-phosphoshikimate 1-carboxyvinyltransferase